MIQNVLRNLGGIENFGMLSLILFFTCFTGMLIWALLLKKPFLQEMSRLPLELETEDSDKGNCNHDHE
jgi:hypothetical protein